MTTLGLPKSETPFIISSLERVYLFGSYLTVTLGSGIPKFRGKFIRLTTWSERKKKIREQNVHLFEHVGESSSPHCYVRTEPADRPTIQGQIQNQLTAKKFGPSNRASWPPNDPVSLRTSRLSYHLGLTKDSKGGRKTQPRLQETRTTAKSKEPKKRRRTLKPEVQVRVNKSASSQGSKGTQ